MMRRAPCRSWPICHQCGGRTRPVVDTASGSHHQEAENVQVSSSRDLQVTRPPGALRPCEGAASGRRLLAEPRDLPQAEGRWAGTPCWEHRHPSSHPSLNHRRPHTALLRPPPPAPSANKAPSSNGAEMGPAAFEVRSEDRARVLGCSRPA